MNDAGYLITEISILIEFVDSHYPIEDMRGLIKRNFNVTATHNI
jgi:hypothetical protein